MIEINDKEKCCGCTACYSICPHEAIIMETDHEGFLYPKVDTHRCINCNLCEKICPSLNDSRPDFDLKKTYVAINKNDSERALSSSGGMFVLFAKKVLESSGFVFGAAFDSEFEVYHCGIDKSENLNKLVGSKYMQSRLGDTFSQIKNLLKRDKMVLFVGTTCQVNGLKQYLMKDYPNLYCIDFICLGVPSPKVWSDYLDTYFNKKTINRINFKDKTNGWHTFSLKIESENESFCKNGKNTYFFTGYFRHLYTRPSCSNCVYKLGNRMSDITISDCWGYDSIAPEMDDNKGMSSVICHSEKGLNLFNCCRDDMISKESMLEYVIKYNGGYIKSSENSPLRSAFWKDYSVLPKKKLFKKYCTPDSKLLRKKIANRINRMKKSLRCDW